MPGGSAGHRGGAGDDPVAVRLSELQRAGRAAGGVVHQKGDDRWRPTRGCLVKFMGSDVRAHTADLTTVHVHKRAPFTTSQGVATQQVFLCT